MIIFGTTTLNSTKQTGSFHCPRCSMQRGYEHKKANRFFTLYFIPVIPLGSAGEYVQCSACGGTYGVEVLHYDPQADQAALMADFRRALSLVLLATDHTDRVFVEAISRICEELFKMAVPEEQIEEDLRLARAAGAQLIPFVQTRLGDMPQQGRELLHSSAAQVLAARGGATSRDQEILRQLGAALGLASSPFASNAPPRRIPGSM
jgi:hypothetical protein